MNQQWERFYIHFSLFPFYLVHAYSCSGLQVKEQQRKKKLCLYYALVVLSKLLEGLADQFERFEQVSFLFIK